MWAGAAALAFVALPTRALAIERLCDTRHEDCRAPLLALINAEPAGGGIDVAFWFMTDDRYRQALQKAYARGVRVRVLVDPRANSPHPGNVQELDYLKAARIPMRMKAATSWGDILHWKLMHFESQKTVEWSAGNYTPATFAPLSPYKNYIDEVVHFTSDPRLVNSFRTRFEDFWTDTSGSFKDYANMTSQPYNVRARYYPVATRDPALNFPPAQDYAYKAIVNYQREESIGAANGAKIDVIMFRMSDARHADEMIKAVKAGIKVRLITEQANYRDSRYLWHAYNADRMWAAGASVKDHVNGKSGIVHQKSVILYAQKEVIFGSSNWSSASSNQQYEHNLFSKPCTPGQTTWCDASNRWFNYFVAQFESKWNNRNPYGVVEFRAFVPRPGGTPVNAAPANGASGVATTVTLKWDGGNWNHKYDVYLGTDPTQLPRVATDLIVGSPYTGRYETWKVPFTLSGGRTYYWRVVGKTMASGARSKAAGLTLEKPGPIWSFTTASSSAASTPYTGSPWAVPATIQAENFDKGGQSVAYVDTTAGNAGGVYRSTDVDIKRAASASNGYFVGWTRPGEWLKYTVSVAAAGTYTLLARLANTVSGGSLHVEVDGSNKTGSMSVPNTGSFDVWKTVSRSVSLSSGEHVVRVVFDTAGSSGGVGALDYLKFQ